MKNLLSRTPNIFWWSLPISVLTITAIATLEAEIISAFGNKPMLYAIGVNALILWYMGRVRERLGILKSHAGDDFGTAAEISDRMIRVGAWQTFLKTAFALYVILVLFFPQEFTIELGEVRTYNEDLELVSRQPRYSETYPKETFTRFFLFLYTLAAFLGSVYAGSTSRSFMYLEMKDERADMLRQDIEGLQIRLREKTAEADAKSDQIQQLESELKKARSFQEELDSNRQVLAEKERLIREQDRRISEMQPWVKAGQRSRGLLDSPIKMHNIWYVVDSVDREIKKGKPRKEDGKYVEISYQRNNGDTVTLPYPKS